MLCCLKRNNMENIEPVYENSKKCQCVYNNCIRNIDVYTIVQSFPNNLKDNFTVTFNVYTSEEEVLNPCEVTHLKTNIILDPYIPVSHSIQFFGVHNHLNIKSENQIIFPFRGQQLSVQVCNFSDSRKNIPLHMPIGTLVIKSKEFSDFPLIST
jgi:hypothetical protein